MTQEERQDGPTQLAKLALERATAPDGHVTAATQTCVQNAIDALKSRGGDTLLAEELARAASLLHLMVQARREGRPNLYASKSLRLRRLVACGALREVPSFAAAA